MPKPQISVVKRQREQAKRERAQAKAAKRAQRKIEKANGTADDTDIYVEEEVHVQD